MEFRFFEGKLGEAGEHSREDLAYFEVTMARAPHSICINHEQLNKPKPGQKMGCLIGFTL